MGAAAGCAQLAPLPPPATTAAELPTRWNREGADPADQTAAGDPWQSIGDALLHDLVTEALAANPDLHIAAANLTRARALRDVAAAGQQPEVGLSGSAGRSRSAGRSSNALRIGLDASWEPDFYGALALGVEAAQADAEASAATWQATQLSVAAEVSVAYLQWQGLRAQLDLAQRSVESQRQSQALVGWRVDAGLASELDRQQSRSSLEAARARVPALATSLEQAAHRLSVLVGQPPAALASRLQAAVPLSWVAPSWPAVGVPAELLRRRYDLQAAERRIAAEGFALGQRRAQTRPRFSINGNLAWQAATLSGLSGAGALVAGLAAAVSWPAFDGGSAKAQVAAQQASLDSAQASYRAAVLTALQDVEDQVVALQQVGERIAALERAQAAADEVLVLARQRYGAGLSDFTALLEGERSALSAADSLAGARLDRALAHVRLVKALGGPVPSGAPRIP